MNSLAIKPEMSVLTAKSAMSESAMSKGAYFSTCIGAAHHIRKMGEESGFDVQSQKIQ